MNMYREEEQKKGRIDRGVLVIGGAGHGKSSVNAIYQKMGRRGDVFPVKTTLCRQKVDNTVLVGGIWYQKKLKLSVGDYRTAIGLSQKKKKELNVDIVKEYRLICQKKSTLSRRKREIVTNEFFYEYEKCVFQSKK